MRLLTLTSLIALTLILSLSESQALKLSKNKRDTEAQQGDSKSHHHPVKHWGYRNQDRSLLPNSWHKSHPQCYGKQQSPVNIETASTHLDLQLEPLKVVRDYIQTNETSDETWEIKNNGHSGNKP